VLSDDDFRLFFCVIQLSRSCFFSFIQHRKAGISDWRSFGK
jgi:hypothetical protein